MGRFDRVPELALGEVPQDFPRGLVMYRKAAFREIDDVAGTDRAHHVGARLPAGAGVACEGGDNFHVPRPHRNRKARQCQKTQDRDGWLLVAVRPAGDRYREERPWLDSHQQSSLTVCSCRQPRLGDCVDHAPAFPSPSVVLP